MTQHECVQQETLAKIREKLAAHDSENMNTTKSIEELKELLSKYNFWLLGIMATCIFTLVAVILKK